MARKRRGSTTGKRKKARKASRKTNRRRGKRRSSVGNKITSVYRTVVGAIKDTGRLRNKMEPAGTSETE